MDNDEVKGASIADGVQHQRNPEARNINNSLGNDDEGGDDDGYGYINANEDELDGCGRGYEHWSKSLSLSLYSYSHSTPSSSSPPSPGRNNDEESIPTQPGSEPLNNSTAHQDWSDGDRPGNGASHPSTSQAIFSPSLPSLNISSTSTLVPPKIAAAMPLPHSDQRSNPQGISSPPRTSSESQRTVYPSALFNPPHQQYRPQPSVTTQNRSSVSANNLSNPHVTNTQLDQIFDTTNLPFKSLRLPSTYSSSLAATYPRRSSLTGNAIAHLPISINPGGIDISNSISSNYNNSSSSLDRMNLIQTGPQPNPTTKPSFSHSLNRQTPSQTIINSFLSTSSHRRASTLSNPTHPGIPPSLAGLESNSATATNQPYLRSLPPAALPPSHVSNSSWSSASSRRQTFSSFSPINLSGLVTTSQIQNQSSFATVYHGGSPKILSSNLSHSHDRLSRDPSSLTTNDLRLPRPVSHHLIFRLPYKQQHPSNPSKKLNITTSNLTRDQSSASPDSDCSLGLSDSMTGGLPSKSASAYPLKNLTSRHSQLEGQTLDIIDEPNRLRRSHLAPRSPTVSLSRQPARPQSSLPQLPNASRPTSYQTHTLSPIATEKPLSGGSSYSAKLPNRDHSGSVSSNLLHHTPSSSISSSAPSNNYRGDCISELSESSTANLLSYPSVKAHSTQYFINHFSKHRHKPRAAIDPNIRPSELIKFSAHDKLQKPSFDEKAPMRMGPAGSSSDSPRLFPSSTSNRGNSMSPNLVASSSLSSRKPSRMRTHSGVLEIRLPRNEHGPSTGNAETMNDRGSIRSANGVDQMNPLPVDALGSTRDWRAQGSSSDPRSQNFNRQQNQSSVFCSNKAGPNHSSLQQNTVNRFSKFFSGPDCFRSAKQSTKRKRRNGNSQNSASHMSDGANFSKFNQFLREKVMIYFPIQTFGSLTLLVGIGIAFLVATSEQLVSKPYGIALLFLFGYSWLISISSMIKTVGSDPGILPRGLDPSPEMKWNPSGETDQSHQAYWIENEKKEKVQSGLEAGEWELLPRWIKVEKKARFYSVNKIQGLTVRGTAESLSERVDGGDDDWIQSKWCSTCESYRPPRSSHCRICDCCIEGIDHHCNYLNNCIGARNYRSFFVFLISCTLDLLLIIGCSIWKILNFDNPRHPTGTGKLEGNALSMFVVSIAFLMLIPISALTGYHLFLTFSGLSTVEYIKAQTAKKVLKENKKLIGQYYGSGQATSNSNDLDRKKRDKRSRKKSLERRARENQNQANDFNSNNNHDEAGSRIDEDFNDEDEEGSEEEGRIKTSFGLVLARLCRPGTETWAEWNSYNFEEKEENPYEHLNNNDVNHNLNHDQNRQNIHNQNY